MKKIMILVSLFIFSISSVLISQNERTLQAKSTAISKIKASVVFIVTFYKDGPVSTGTGFFVGSDGIILTNQHVAAGTLHDAA